MQCCELHITLNIWFLWCFRYVEFVSTKLSQNIIIFIWSSDIIAVFIFDPICSLLCYSSATWSLSKARHHNISETLTWQICNISYTNILHASFDIQKSCCFFLWNNNFLMSFEYPKCYDAPPKPLHKENV